MTTVQRAIAVAAAFVLAIGLSACGTAVTDGVNIPVQEIDEFTVTLKDGTQVPCFRLEMIYGFDCNFDKAVRSNAPTP